MTFSEYMLSEHNFKTDTTAWQDLAIADHFSNVEPNAVADTFRRLLDYCKDDIEHVIELLFVIDIRMNQHHTAGREALAKQYADFYHEIYNYVYGYYDEDDNEIPGHYTEEERARFYEMTD